MSTTVTYKGSTLTTAENQTRTLKTIGKYLESDILVVDVTPTYDDGDNIGYGFSNLVGSAIVGTSTVG